MSGMFTRAPWVWLGAVAILVCHGPARAQPRVIEGGREASVQALFLPYRLGGEVRDGWRLWSIAIEPRAIRVGLERGGVSVRVTLVPIDAAPRTAPRTASFAVQQNVASDARPASDALLEAVRRNDRGGFWAASATPTDAASQDVAPEPGGNVATDGILLALAGLLLLLALTVRAIRDEPRADAKRIALVLVVIVVAGALLRIGLAPDTMLEAWPYSRIHLVASAVARGPVLAYASTALDARVPLEETIFWTNFAFGVVTPIAVFVQARALHRDATTALVAAALLAVLPDHIRFSRSDTAFIASLLMSCIADVLVQVACEDRNRGWRAVATVLLAPLVFAMLSMRPLNTLFVTLFVAHALVLVRRDVPRLRRIVVAGVVVATGAASAVVYLFANFSREIHDSLSLGTLVDCVGAFFTRAHNTLIHPWITPPLLTAFAIGGAVWLWRQPARAEPDTASGRTRTLYLVAWLLAFFLTHAVVLPREPAMQARYHLHVLLPFIYLAAPALVAFHLRLPRIGRVVAVALALSPFVHLGFIRDLSFDQTREYEFLREVGARIPAQCTVVEYLPRQFRAAEARMPRVGRVLERGRWRDSWRIRIVRDAPAAIAALRGGGRCAVWIQSLACFARKRPSEPIAPACAEVRQALSFDLIAERRFRHRNYDENLSHGFLHARDPHVTFAALRLVVRPRTAPTTQAQPRPQTRTPTRVIAPDHEREVEALFSPYVLGGEVRDGWRIWSIAIEPSAIRVTLRKDEVEASLRLLPSDTTQRPPPAAESASFALAWTASAGARPAIDALVGAVRRNDRGSFWTSEVTVRGTGQPQPQASTDPIPIGLGALSSTLVLAAVALRKRDRAWRAALALAVLALGAALVRVLLFG